MAALNTPSYSDLAIQRDALNKELNGLTGTSGKLPNAKNVARANEIRSQLESIQKQMQSLESTTNDSLTINAARSSIDYLQKEIKGLLDSGIPKDSDRVQTLLNRLSEDSKMVNEYDSQQASNKGLETQGAAAVAAKNKSDAAAAAQKQTDTQVSKQITDLENQKVIAQAMGQSTDNIDKQIAQLQAKTGAGQGMTPQTVSGQSVIPAGMSAAEIKAAGTPVAAAGGTKKSSGAAAKVTATGPTGGLNTEVGGVTDAASAEQALKDTSAAAYGFWHQDQGTGAIDPSRPAWQQSLSGFLDAAIKNGWIANQASFQNYFGQTDWYKKNGPQAVLAADDYFNRKDTVWKASVANRTNEVKDIATSMGYNLSDNTLQEIAQTSLWNAYSADAYGNQGYQDQLRSKIVQTAAAANVLSGGGAEQTNINTLKSYAQSMGINYTADWFTNIANRINDPTQKFDITAAQNQIKSDAKLQWNGYADKIDSGMTVADIVSPYVQSMQQILGIPANNINIATDPYIRKAAGLTVAADGTQQAQPLWQFENQLRQDPRWQYTTDAHNQLADAGSQILKNWGLMA